MQSYGHSSSGARVQQSLTMSSTDRDYHLLDEEGQLSEEEEQLSEDEEQLSEDEEHLLWEDQLLQEDQLPREDQLMSQDLKHSRKSYTVAFKLKAVTVV